MSHAFFNLCNRGKKEKIPVVLARRYFFLNIAAIRRAGPGMAIPFTVRLTDKPHLIGKGSCAVSPKQYSQIGNASAVSSIAFWGQKFLFISFFPPTVSGIFPGTFPFSFYIIHAAFYSNKNCLFIREHLPHSLPSPFWLSLNPEGEAVGHRSDLLTRFFRVFRRFSRCLALSPANWEQLPHILETAAGGNQMPFLNMATHSWKNRVPALEPGCKSPNEILKDSLTV